MNQEETISEKEKIKADFADFLDNLNATSTIDYSAYSELWDYSMELFDQMYEQGKKDAQQLFIVKETKECT